MSRTYIDRKSEQINLDVSSENKILKDIIKEKLGLDDKEIQRLVKTRSEILIPVSIYHNRLSTLEATVKYLKENLQLRNIDIADLLKRSEKTIWSAYNRAVSHDLLFESNVYGFEIPLKVLADRKYSILEALVAYLKEDSELSLAEIASLLTLDPRTIWTVYARYKKKK